MTMNEKRKLTYPNTDCFIYHNNNPKNKITGDCVIRALSLALDKSWEEVAKELFELSLSLGYTQISNETIEKYLKKNNWIKNKEPRKLNNSKYLVKEFCHLTAEKNKVYIMNAGTNHIICIKDKKVYDTWYSQNTTAHCYWTYNE